MYLLLLLLLTRKTLLEVGLTTTLLFLWPWTVDVDNTWVFVCCWSEFPCNNKDYLLTYLCWLCHLIVSFCHETVLWRSDGSSYARRTLLVVISLTERWVCIPSSWSRHQSSSVSISTASAFVRSSINASKTACFYSWVNVHSRGPAPDAAVINIVQLNELVYARTWSIVPLVRSYVRHTRFVMQTHSLKFSTNADSTKIVDCKEIAEQFE